MNTNLKARVEECLKAKNMTKSQLAEKLGITDVSISRWLSGTTPITVENLEKIATELGTTSSYLLSSGQSEKTKDIAEKKQNSGTSTGLKVTFGVILGLVIAAVAAGILSKDEKNEIVDVLEGKDESIE